MSAVALTVAILLLIPSFILTEIRRQSAQSQLNNVTVGTTTDEKTDAEVTIERANKKLQQVASDQEFTPTDVVKVVVNTKPDAVSLRKLGLNYGKGGQYNVNLIGVAATRDSLLSFRDQMRKNMQINNINLPISTLTTKKNTEFSLSLKVLPINQQ